MKFSALTLPPRLGCFFAAVLAVVSFSASGVHAQPRERRLHIATAEASSYLINDWNRFSENYLPLYIGDDDPKTAWTLKTEGIGEWIRIRATPMDGASQVRLRIRNGYQKSPSLFVANSRARLVKVVLMPSKAETVIELKDAPGWQEAVVEQRSGAFEGVEVHVESVYPGNKYDDLCISDVQMFVTAATPENPAYEKQRFDKIQTWKKERLAAAKLFQTNIGKALPVASAYASVKDEPPRKLTESNEEANQCGDDQCWLALTIKNALAHARSKHGKRHTPAGLLAAQSLINAQFKGMLPVKVTTRDKRPLPRVDGLCSFQLDACIDDPCYEALPLPAQLGFSMRRAYWWLSKVAFPLCKKRWRWPQRPAIAASQPPSLGSTAIRQPHRGSPAWCGPYSLSHVAWWKGAKKLTRRRGHSCLYTTARAFWMWW